METDTIDLLEVLATDVDRAFEALVFIYQDQLYTFVLRQVRSPQDAEDIVQETFLQVYHALKRYPPERIRSHRTTIGSTTRSRCCRTRGGTIYVAHPFHKSISPYRFKSTATN